MIRRRSEGMQKSSNVVEHMQSTVAVWRELHTTNKFRLICEVETTINCVFVYVVRIRAGHVWRLHFHGKHVGALAGRAPRVGSCTACHHARQRGSHAAKTCRDALRQGFDTSQRRHCQRLLGVVHQGCSSCAQGKKAGAGITQRSASSQTSQPSLERVKQM